MSVENRSSMAILLREDLWCRRDGPFHSHSRLGSLDENDGPADGRTSRTSMVRPLRLCNLRLRARSGARAWLYCVLTLHQGRARSRLELSRDVPEIRQAVDEEPLVRVESWREGWWGDSEPRSTGAFGTVQYGRRETRPSSVISMVSLYTADSPSHSDLLLPRPCLDNSQRASQASTSDGNGFPRHSRHIGNESLELHVAPQEQDAVLCNLEPVEEKSIDLWGFGLVFRMRPPCGVVVCARGQALPLFSSHRGRGCVLGAIFVGVCRVRVLNFDGDGSRARRSVTRGSALAPSWEEVQRDGCGDAGGVGVDVLASTGSTRSTVVSASCSPAARCTSCSTTAETTGPLE